MKPYISYLIVLTLIFTACKNSENNPPENESDSHLISLTEDQFQSNTFQIGGFTKEPFPSFIRTQGTIDVPPENKAAIHAMMGGFVKKISLLVGDQVEKGQIVLTLENPQFIALQQEFLETREQLAFLKSEYERQTTLFNEKITSQKNFLKAESDYKTAVARLESLNKQLQLVGLNPQSLNPNTIQSQVQLRAPISGFVSAVFVNSGSYVSENEPLMELVNNDHMHLELQVFESDIPKLRKEQVIHFKTSETSKESYRGYVYLIGTTVNSQTRTTQVHGHLPDSIANRFAVGMFVEAQIETESSKSVALPKDAIVEDEDKYYALLKIETEGLQFKKVKLDVGKESNGFVEIKNADTFPASAQFLVKGAYNLIGE